MTLRLLLLSGLIPAITACTRPETASVTVALPDATLPGELSAIQEDLQAEHDQLPDGVDFYRDIELLPPPQTGLRIEYVTRYQREQNILHRINRLGYPVGSLPGNPDAHRAFLRKSGLAD